MLYKWLPNWWLIIWHIWGHFSHLTCILYRLLAPFNPFCKLFIICICRGQGKYPIFFFYKYNCHSVISTAKDWQAISVGWDVQHIFQLQAACVAITSWFQLNYHLRDCSQFGAPTACMLSQWTMHGMVRLFWPYSAVSQSSSLCVFMPHVIGVVAQIGIVLVTGLILLVSTPLPSHEDHQY